ncbi:histidine kinase N-terminal 7TM domain-containing diguanylate cyclase [Cryptosporangium minutisporangium]|uniref:Histidine kinase N-terminal 7TM domain-containing protein n=1 Tax=Cryptosporangium minutisporangium TaxID=113569 RepID=A0ABP6SRJ5_9ACTN
MRSVLVAAYGASALVAALPAVLAFRRRHRAALCGPLALLLVAATEWCAAQAASVAVGSADLAVAFNYAIYPAVAAVTAGSLWYSRVVADRPALSARAKRLLWIHPIALIAVVATDQWHHLFYLATAASADKPLAVQPGPLYWLHVAYCYTVLCFVYVRLVRAAIHAVARQRRILVYSIVAGLAPLAGNVATLVLGGRAQTLDLTPILFVVTGALWCWIERYGAAGRDVPIAYNRVLAAIGDAVMVLDADGRFLDVNPAAARLLAGLGRGNGTVIGRDWRQVVGSELTALLTGPDQRVVTAADGRILDVRIVRMDGDRRHYGGSVVVIRDVTELERLRAALAEQARCDPLTNAHNRRHLAEVLEQETAAAAATGAPLSVVLLDIDHFKQINDGYGHAEGDRVLVRLVDELRSAAPADATVARYGGEEFVVVLPSSDVCAAADQAEQWRRRFAEIVVPTAQGPLRATFSAGIAQLVPDQEPEQLLCAADAALYAAKAAGRNRVVASQPGETSALLAAATVSA